MAFWSINKLKALFQIIKMRFSVIYFIQKLRINKGQKMSLSSANSVPFSLQFQNQNLKNGPFLITIDSNIKRPRFQPNNHWSLSEKTKLLIYLENNEEKFKNCIKEEKWSLFKDLAKFIKTRNFNQCRNYLAKLIRQFGSLNKWKQFLIEENKIFPEQYLSLLQQSEMHEKHEPQREKSSVGIEKREFFEKKSNIINECPNNLKVTAEIRMGQNLFTNFGAPIANNSSMPINIFKRYYPSLEEKASREAELRQCHKLFLEWCHKVNELVQMQRYEQK